MNAVNPDNRIVNCTNCGQGYNIDRRRLKPGTNVRCTKCGHVFPLGPDVEAPPPAKEGARILVASDGEELRTLVEEVLAVEGFSLRSAREGEEAWLLIRQWQPQATVLDVGLPGIPVFEICDRVRQDSRHSGLGIVLLASVYQHTRYKRAPTSLYGADDYIEKHHLRDALVGKVRRLLPGKETPPGQPPPVPPEEAGAARRPPPPPHVTPQEEETLVREEQFGSSQPTAAQSESQRDALRRFARIIVSDIALYNQEQVEKGIRGGNLQQLLAKEIEEGRQLFETRVPTGTQAGSELYIQALEEFIAKQRGRFFSAGGGR